MASHDLQGREYAKLNEINIGDKIEIDDGFDCSTPGIYTVEGDAHNLFWRCNQGEHSFINLNNGFRMSAQDNGDGYLMGIYKVQP